MADPRRTIGSIRSPDPLWFASAVPIDGTTSATPSNAIPATLAAAATPATANGSV